MSGAAIGRRRYAHEMCKHAREVVPVGEAGVRGNPRDVVMAGNQTFGRNRDPAFLDVAGGRLSDRGAEYPTEMVDADPADLRQ